VKIVLVEGCLKPTVECW